MDKHEKSTILTKQEDGLARATSQSLHKKSKNGMEWTKGKQDLEEARLPQMLERSCWKTNNEKSKLVVGLWRTSQNYEVKFCH